MTPESKWNFHHPWMKKVKLSRIDYVICPKPRTSKHLDLTPNLALAPGMLLLHQWLFLDGVQLLMHFLNPKSQSQDSYMNEI